MPPETHAAPSLKVLFVTPECAPLAKTGGLGDVSAALPPALRAAGIDARVLLPGYPAVLAAGTRGPDLARVPVLGHEVALRDAVLPTGVPLLVADCPALYARGGGPYQADDGNDWEDNALRFGVLSRLAATLGGEGSPLAWRPDVVHCNDWPAAVAPVYLRFDRGRRAASLVTIHNLAFQGLHTAAQVRDIALPAAATGMDGMEFYGRLSFLKGGLAFADAINTVSPTYAREIQGEALGFGLDGVLRARSDRLFGVLNGIDTAAWNPQADAHIAARYGPLTLERKLDNKLALKQRMGLAGGGERPVLGIVSRLTHQKGIDVILDALPALLAMGAQLAVVGTGDRELVARLQDASLRHAGDVAFRLAFDEGLAHQLEAGADVFLMPSRFEPCGMNQMYSQRYGTPPVANATGGLVDTIEDGVSGYLMKSATAAELVAAVERALADRREPRKWRALQLHGMSKDFGWGPAAARYREIYETINGVRLHLS